MLRSQPAGASPERVFAFDCFWHITIFYRNTRMAKSSPLKTQAPRRCYASGSASEKESTSSLTGTFRLFLTAIATCITFAPSLFLVAVTTSRASAVVYIYSTVAATFTNTIAYFLITVFTRTASATASWQRTLVTDFIVFIHSYFTFKLEILIGCSKTEKSNAADCYLSTPCSAAHTIAQAIAECILNIPPCLYS